MKTEPIHNNFSSIEDKMFDTYKSTYEKLGFDLSRIGGIRTLEIAGSFRIKKVQDSEHDGLFESELENHLTNEEDLLKHLYLQNGYIVININNFSKSKHSRKVFYSVIAHFRDKYNIMPLLIDKNTLYVKKDVAFFLLFLE